MLVTGFSGDRLSLPLIGTTTIAVALTTYALFFRKGKQEEDAAASALIVSPTSMWENMVELGSSRNPFWILALSRKLGTMNFVLRMPGGGGQFVMVGDHRLARQIFKDRTSDKPRLVYQQFEGIGAKTMFTSGNDAYMKALRKSTAHAFSKNEVGRMNAVATKYCEEYMNVRLQQCAETGESFDPAYELNYLTFQVICEAAFEYQNTKEEFETFGQHAEIAIKEFTGKSAMNPLRPIFGMFIPEVRQARASMRWLLQFCAKVLDAYRQNPNKSPNNTLIKILHDNTSVTSEYQRQSEVKDWLTAGHDTTGYSLSNTLTLLALHPNVQSKLREAIRNTSGKPEDCEYFRHVLQESMRCMPVAAGGSIRTSGRAFVTQDTDGKKTIVPQHSVCLCNQYLMNHNPAVYGADNEEFRPERWETPTDEMKQAMFPFALGQRSCPGQSLAMSEINSVLPKLLSEFEFEVEEEGTKVYFLTLKFVGTRLRAKKL